MMKSRASWIAVALVLGGCGDVADDSSKVARQGAPETSVLQSVESNAASVEDDIDSREYGSRDEAVTAAANPQIDFAHRFSSSYLNCGTGCVSVWFVDRQTGKVVEAPFEGADDQMIDDMKTNPDSEIVEVTYGDRNGADACSSQKFKWTGHSFERLSSPLPSPCPKH